MRHLSIYESYSNDKSIKLTSKSNKNIEIKIKGGRISEVENNSGVRFPYSVGEYVNEGIKTWACNNGFKWNGEDPCPEKKVFGIKQKDIPQGHELRMMFPHKFK